MDWEHSTTLMHGFCYKVAMIPAFRPTSWCPVSAPLIEPVRWPVMVKSAAGGQRRAPLRYKTEGFSLLTGHLSTPLKALVALLCGFLSDCERATV